jgi:hypothetical protein
LVTLIFNVIEPAPCRRKFISKLKMSPHSSLNVF